MATSNAMNAQAPRNVVWVHNSFPANLDAELSQRDLSTVRFSNGTKGIAQAVTAGARAVLYRIAANAPDPLIKKILERSRAALDNGSLVVLSPVNLRVHSLTLQLLAEQYPVSVAGADHRFWPLVHREDDPANLHELAQRCAAHPNHRATAGAMVERVGQKVILAEDVILLQRAFNECSKLYVECVYTRGMGLDISKIYKVKMLSPGANGPIFFIAKTMALAGVDTELGVYRSFLPRNTPFANVPPLAENRCVTTSRRSCVVTQFVDRAILFKDYIQTHDPALAIAALFDGPLRCWRNNSYPENINVFERVIPGVIPDRPEDLRKTYDRAVAAGENVRPPDALFAALREAPAQQGRMCFSHGDLHLGNVFVRAGSCEPVLIDFNRATDHPTSRDPAELEAALAFGDLQGARRLNDTIRNLYSSPLLEPPVLARTENRRALAIEQLRRQIVGSTSETEYRIMFACHALYYARKGVIDAYVVADSLV